MNLRCAQGQRLSLQMHRCVLCVHKQRTRVGEHVAMRKLTNEFSNYIEEIVVSAISYHLMQNKDPVYRNGKRVISSTRQMLILTRKLQTNADSDKETEGQEAVSAKTESKSETAKKSDTKNEAEKSGSAAKKESENPLSSKVGRTRMLLTSAANTTYPNTPGTFHLQAELFCYQDLQNFIIKCSPRL